MCVGTTKNAYVVVQSQLVKLQKALKPEEFAAAMVNVTNRFGSISSSNFIGSFYTSEKVCLVKCNI